MELYLMVFGPMFLLLMVIIVALCFVTRKTAKVIITDILWGIIFLVITVIFLSYQIESWNLRREGALIIFPAWAYHLVINSIFLIVQVSITLSKNNQENIRKMLIRKKICLLINMVLVFWFYFFDAIFRYSDIKWAQYILVFTTASYILFSLLFRKIIGVKEPTILQKLIIKMINAFCVLINKIKRRN